MDKIDRLLDAIANPDLYTEKDLEEMLADPETREVYDLLATTQSALTPVSAPDIDAEWESFKESHPAAQRHSTFSLRNLTGRHIAASIAIGVVSLAAVAAVVGAGVGYLRDRNVETSSTSIAATTEENIAAGDTVVVAVEEHGEAPETIIFDNEPLAAIAIRIAEYYGCKVEFSAEAPESLRLYFRWNQDQSLDEVVGSLNNFEQIHIAVKDNTLIID